MSDDRDYSGMYEIEPGVWVKRVHIYENDPMWLAMRAEQAEINTKLGAVLAVLNQMGFASGGLKVKLI